MPERLIRLVAFNEELHSIVNEKINSDLQDTDRKGLFLSFVLAKAFKTHEATVLLCKNGYGEDAFMLTRTIFELLVTAGYILNDVTEDQLTRYMSYDWVTRKQMYDYIKTKPDLLASLQNQEETLAEVEREYAAAQATYNYRHGWSDQSIEGMSRAIGRGDMYSTVYRLQCTVGHANARSMNEYVLEGEQEEEGVILNIGPNWSLAETSLVILFDCYFHVVKEAATRFDWSLDDRLEELSNRYSEEVRGMKTIENA